MIDLDEAERLGKAATAGPWELFEIDERRSAVVPEFFPVSPLVFPLNELAESNADAKFVCFARNNWQAMIDRIRELENHVSNMRTLMYGEPRSRPLPAGDNGE